MKDDLGDRMKGYENVESKRTFMRTQPLIARLDGRNFSKFTRGFKKPFDPMLTSAMDHVTKTLVAKTNASIGYTQSDEITLIWPAVDGITERFFNDREQKLCSVLASKAAVEFCLFMLDQAESTGRLTGGAIVQARRPHFDCRAWNVPSEGEAANTLLWRAQDARRNGISVFCQQHVSHKKLQGLDQFEMLKAARANGAPDITVACTSGELFGRYFKRVTVQQELSQDVWENIPEEKRPPRDTKFTRTKVERLDIGYLGDIGTQEERKGVIFDAI